MQGQQKKKKKKYLKTFFILLKSVFDGHETDYCASWLASKFDKTLDKILSDTKNKPINENEIIKAYKSEDENFISHCDVKKK